MAEPEIIALVARTITDKAVHQAAEERKSKLVSIAQSILPIVTESVIGVAINRFFPEKEAKQGDWIFQLDQPAFCTCGEMYPVSTIIKMAEPHDQTPGKAIMTKPLFAWCPVCDKALDIFNAEARQIRTGSSGD